MRYVEAELMALKEVAEAIDTETKPTEVISK